MNNVAGNFPLLKVVVLIVNADKSSRVVNLFHNFASHVQYQFRAEGTATSEILDILGLGSVEKAITICIVPDVIVDQLLQKMSEEFSLYMPGKGVVFTIPISGIAGQTMALLRLSDDNSLENLKNSQSEVIKMKTEIEHHLIISAVNQGFSEALMDAAKQAGATGGTVWSSRNIGAEEPVKILGITMQAEQEIVIMLVPKDKKLDIMKAINENFGITSEANGIVLSLPVDDVLGLNKKTVE